jgi:pimeloyl-ACP methyl ester carboxylesterase
VGEKIGVKEIVFTFIKIVVLVAVTGSLLLYFFQERLIFFTQKVWLPERSRFAKYEITIDHRGTCLRGWFIKKSVSKSSPLIIYYGGNAEEVSVNLTALHRFKAGAFLYMNYRGYGESEGSPSEKALFEDALYILDHMIRKENIDPHQVILMGRSLGSGVAVHVASCRKVSRVILITPFDSLLNVAKYHYPFFPVDLMLKHRFDSISLAPGIKIPALFIMGKKDQIIPNRYSLNLMEKWGGPVESVTIAGASHNDIDFFREYDQAINRFILTSNDAQAKE